MCGWMWVGVDGWVLGVGVGVYGAFQARHDGVKGVKVNLS